MQENGSVGLRPQDLGGPVNIPPVTNTYVYGKSSNKSQAKHNNDIIYVIMYYNHLVLYTGSEDHLLYYILDAPLRTLAHNDCV